MKLTPAIHTPAFCTAPQVRRSEAKITPETNGAAGQLTLLFFLTKAELVNDILRNATITSLIKWTRFGLIVFIPCFVVPYAVVRARGVRTSEGVCVLFLQEVWFPAVFSVGSALLSFLLLFLFVRPLKEQAKKTATTNSVNSKAMTKTAGKNVRLTTVIVVCSTLSVIGTCVVTGLAATDVSKFGFVLLYSYASTVVDLAVCCFAARLMTNMWMPKTLRQRASSSQHPPHSQDSTNGTAVTPYQSRRLAPVRMLDAVEHDNAVQEPY
jgi:hypothetical protein